MKLNKTMANSLTTYILILLFNPLIAVVISAKEAVKNNRYTSLLIFAIMVALYASVINTTKIPISDQINYLEHFNNVDKVGFTQTLFFGGGNSIKEPVYSIYVYLTYYLFFGNAKLFFLLTSFLSLIFHYMAMINIAKKYRYPNYIVITGIIVLTFFTPFYSLTLHLIRQILATSIVIYAISLRMLDASKYKVYLPLMAIAVLTHSTSILLVLLAFIPHINKDFNIKRLFGFVLFIVVLAFTFPKLSENILGGSESDSFMTYALSRAKEAEELSEKSNIDTIIMYLISIYLLLISLHSYYTKRKDASPIFTNICIMMCLFVLCMSYSPLIQYRYFFVLYSCMLFTIPITLKISTNISKLFCFVANILVVIYFLSTYTGNYDYANIGEIIAYPFPLYFTINPY